MYSTGAASVRLECALKSKKLRDPFVEWPELDIMEVEVSCDESEDESDPEL